QLARDLRAPHSFPTTTLFRSTVIEEQTQPAVESEPQRQEGSYQEQVCQTEPEDADNDYVAQVIRPHILRGHILAGHSTATTKCGDRKSTRLNSSHVSISYAVF